MYIQIVTFGLEGLSDEEYVAGCEAQAADFATIPGLMWKVWLRDPATGTYGGVKAWADEAAMRTYLDGEVWREIVTAPAFVDVQSRGLAVLDSATRVTRGFPAVAV